MFMGLERMFFFVLLCLCVASNSGLYGMEADKMPLQTGLARADMLVVTKCPKELTEKEGTLFVSKCLMLCGKSLARPKEGVFFSTMSYAPPYKVFGGGETTLAAIGESYKRVVVLAAIARPAPFADKVRHYCNVACELLFADHHAFTTDDLLRLEKAAGNDGSTAVITTEKDAARLMSCAGRLSPVLRDNIYALPVKVEFLFNGQTVFNDKILGYVQQYQGNR